MGANGWGHLVIMYEPEVVEPDGSVALPCDRWLRPGDEVVVAPLLDQALGVYPPEIWSELVERRRMLPDVSPDVRLLFEAAHVQAADREVGPGGVITLPHSLRHQAGIDEAAIPVRARAHLELWDPVAWTNRQLQDKLRRRVDGAA
jgi:DNA-binding transcriptional regulator/RsmH inhibitor MraZ